MKPALTREEWREFEKRKNWPDQITDHGAAARCLYRKSYGFNYDMVLAIRALARKAQALHDLGFGVDDDIVGVALEAAERIEMLLPEGA